MDERHRHRFEVNPTLVEQLESAGLRFVGKDETGQRMEVGGGLDPSPVCLMGSQPCVSAGLCSVGKDEFGQRMEVGGQLGPSPSCLVGS